MSALANQNWSCLIKMNPVLCEKKLRVEDDTDY